MLFQRLLCGEGPWVQVSSRIACISFIILCAIISFDSNVVITAFFIQSPP